MNARDRAVVASATAALTPVSLEAVVDVAPLQTRTDRKYLVGPDLFAALTRSRPDMAVLEIDGVRSFRYESVYFDTPALHSYHGAAHDRRGRFKVRTRSYLDSGACFLEVKTRSGREETLKRRIAYHFHDHGRLTADGLAFVAEHVRLPDVSELTPVLVTSYRRTTIIDVSAATRLTVDAGLRCLSIGGDWVSLPDHLLVETKSEGPPTAADRFLWRAGHRPVTVSKYCLGMAALDPVLPANKWNRTLRRYFGWTPDRAGDARPATSSRPTSAAARRSIWV